MHHTRHPAVLALLAGALLLAFATPASAQVTHIQDRKDDGVRILGEGTQGPSRNGDIRAVRVDHRLRRVDVTVLPHRQSYGGERMAAIYDVWVDTRGKGFPEYVVQWNLETSRVYVDRAARFRHAGPVCSMPMGRYDFRRAHMVVPRRCLGRPQRLRVSVQAMDNDSTVRSDWAPGYHRYGPWTRRG